MLYSAFPITYSLVCCRKPLILLTLWEYRYPTLIFNRPGFAALLEEVEAGRVETLVVKGLSRFARNYLQVGYYTEILFPKKGVRFIAINNNVDSATPQDNDFTPFLNIMNEWYAKDTSNKIKAIFKSRMKDGIRCSGSIPYGYKRKPDDKQTLIVDEPAAEVALRMRPGSPQSCQGPSAKGRSDANHASHTRPWYSPVAFWHS